MRFPSKIIVVLCLCLLFSLPVAAQNSLRALPDTITLSLGAPRDSIAIPAQALLSNDSSMTGNLTVVSVGQSARGGTPTIDPASGKIVYPLPTFYAPLVGVFTDTFEYTITDGSLHATSYVTMNLHNSAPIASDVYLDMPVESPGRPDFSVLLGGGSSTSDNCGDDDDKLNNLLWFSACGLVLVVQTPTCGAVTSDGNDWIYTPIDATGNPCPSGTYLIPYQVSDYWGATSNLAYFHVTHNATIGEVLNSNASLDSVSKPKPQKQWLPANFRISGSLLTDNKVKVSEWKCEDKCLNENDDVFCGETDHLRGTGSSRNTCTCQNGWSGADCGVVINNVAGGSVKFTQDIPNITLTDEDTLTFSFIVNAHTSAFDSRKLSAKAFVTGTDIVFDCRPEGMLAHEAAHVVQQRCVRPSGGTALPTGTPITLRFVVTYKSGQTNKGKISLTQLALIKNGDVGFQRPGDVLGGSVASPLLPLPPTP